MIDMAEEESVCSRTENAVDNAKGKVMLRLMNETETHVLNGKMKEMKTENMHIIHI